MSTVATEEKPAERTWTRTPEQERIVADYLAMIAEQYAGADPELVALLRDPEIVGTPEMVEMLGYSVTPKSKGTRVFQLYTKARDLAADDQVPHPSAVPEADAFAGRRGAREIRGVMRGRVNYWRLQSGRWWWNPIEKTLIRQEEINVGGAPKQP